MRYEFLVPKKFDWWSKKCHFRWNFRRKFFSNIFIAPKDSSLNFRGSLLSYFWAILLISAVITILEDFGSLLPVRTVTVKSNENLHFSAKITDFLSKPVLCTETTIDSNTFDMILFVDSLVDQWYLEKVRCY